MPIGLAAAAIIGGSALLGGLINSWSGKKAIEAQLKAQGMADKTHLQMFERSQRSEDARFKKNLKLSKAQLAEQQKMNKYTMANNTVTNILNQLNSRADVRNKLIAASRGRR